MGLFFGRPKNYIGPCTRINSHDRAVLKMKQQRDIVKQYRQRFENKMELEREMAKRLLAENRTDKALLLLRKKKYQTTQLERADEALNTIEQLIQELEFTQIQAQVVENIELGSAALRRAQEVLTIENIEKLMEESQEGILKQQEITYMLSGQLSNEDEDAAEAELDELIDIENQKLLDSLLPVPSDNLPVTVSEPEAEEKLPPKKIALEAQ